ncbi:FIST N-terminal domain-containing protein [Novosphingobium piscinae]|uniref:FIST C-terminal domain-containing protein n=1 Tax=Novosphingobium piscinae TaxID=1507448 RepID=A0A7X1FZY2_9SPHN|nr:FIST N-terminal domain-containing protein [Novosphingobium piscinae]MBC2670090.1 FIST C-terminal domain-containing protein [Novosphingobium piscinae]
MEERLAQTGLADDLAVVSSHRSNPADAVAEVVAGIGGRRLAGGLLFCSHRYPREPLARALAGRLGGLPLIGCTSAGELSQRGYDEDSLVFIGFPASDFRMALHCFDDLDHFDPAMGREAIRRLAARLTRAELGGEAAPLPNRAAIFLVDGLSHREELLAMTVQEALGDTPMVGGSSGDGMRFRETGILVGDRFLRDAAVVALLSSRRPMQAFTANHYLPGAEKMVVTAADPAARVVHQINALPAADEYLRLAGRTGEQLDAAFFAAHPPMVRAGGGYHVRSIQSVNPDGSLTFYCAIDNGIVLSIGEPVDRLSQLERLFDGLEAGLGGIDHVIGFDCVLNRIDAERRQLQRAVSELYAQRGVVGFNTYGEQFRAAHINQTLSGLAIGR